MTAAYLTAVIAAAGGSSAGVVLTHPHVDDAEDADRWAIMPGGGPALHAGAGYDSSGLAGYRQSLSRPADLEAAS